MKPSRPILVYLGANAHKELVHQLVEMSPDIQFVESAIYPERSCALFEDNIGADSIIAFDSGLKTEPGRIEFTPVGGCNRLEIIESIMSDKHLSLLWTRFDAKTRWCNRSEVKRYEVIYSLIKSAIDACITRNPRVVVFSYEPHMLPIYVFKKVCEALGVQTYTLIVSPFNWKMLLDVTNSGNGEYQKIQAKRLNGDTASASVQQFINEKKSDYSVAKPFYEKRMIGLSPGKRFLYKLKANSWKPHKVLSSQRASAKYVKLTTDRYQLQGMKYICVFLQLQPEQTTLPDGGLFVHHLFAIQMLYSAVSPLGISLIVREHPATFECASDSKWRPADFYSSIKSIGSNIYFDDINADPYSLIINSLAVSAITGTVLLESLLQGKPAIAFGKHPLKGYYATAFVDCFSDEDELREKISKAILESPQSISRDVERYLANIYPATFGPSEYLGNENMSLEKLREVRYTALRQVLELISKSGT